MAYQPLVDVDITISAVQISADGFGTPLFITSHRKHLSRIETYIDAAGVLEVYGLDSAAYRAALQVFGQSPSVNLFKIGRRDAKLELTPIDFETGDTLGFRIMTKAGTFHIIQSAIFDADPTAEEIVLDLETKILAISELDEDVVVTVNGPTLTLSTALDGVDWKDAYFEVDAYTDTGSGNSDFTGKDIWKGTEAAAQAITEISEQDSDYYFISADDNSHNFVKDMSAIVETFDKMYFVSDKNALNIASVTEIDLSLLGELSALSRNHTVFLFHQDAGDSAIAFDHESADYPEIAWVGANAVYSPGSVTWANLSLSGVSESRSVNGRRLTTNMKINLEARNGNFVEYDAGSRFTRFGQATGNEWIDTVRGVHWQTGDLSVNLKSLLLGQKGGKITFDGNGFARIREVIASSLQRGVNRNFLSNFTIQMPRLSEISGNDKLARLLKDVTFTANIAGAIHEIAIRGTVSEG